MKKLAKAHSVRAFAAPMEEDSFSAWFDSQVDEAGLTCPQKVHDIDIMELPVYLANPQLVVLFGLL